MTRLKLMLKLMIIIFHSFGCLSATELTISQPGIYQLGAAILSNPAGTNNIINITASDVILDLGGYVISQGNGTADVDGIVVNPNLTDIVIRNGTIRNVTRNGLSLAATDSRIRINNIIFENCAGTAMTADGSLGTINDIELTQCRFYGCSSAGTSVILWNTVSRSSITNAVIDGSVNAAVSFACMSLLTCTACSFSDITIQNNTSTNPFNGINESLNAYCYFSNVVIRNNSNSGGGNGFNGFNNVNGIACNYLNCSVIGNSSAALLQCFVLNPSTGNLYSQCRAINNTGVTVNGFLDSAAGSRNIFLDCIVNSLSGSGTVYSLQAANSIIGRSVASNSSSSTGLTNSGSAAQRLTVFDCLFSRNNNGAVDAVSTTGNLYYRNAAFSNTVAQFSGAGFSLTTPAAPATQNIAAVTQSWTNLAVAA